MSRLIDKLTGTRSGIRRDGGRALTPPSGAKDPGGREDPTFHLDISVDDAMLALDACLSSLAAVEVGQAAKERGWAVVQRELQRHPVRPAAPALLKGTGAKQSRGSGSLQPVLAGHSRGWRIALSSAGALVVILAVVLGIYGAGLLGGGGGPVVNVNSTLLVDVTVPSSSDVTTPTSESVDDTQTTQAPGVTEPAPGTTSVNTTGSETATSEVAPTTNSTTRPTSGSTTPTTKPSSTTTTNPVVVVSAEREKSARSVVADLGAAVLAHFMGSGDISNILRRVPPDVQKDLTQLVSHLDEPTDAHVIYDSLKVINSDTVRLTLEFVDIAGSPRFFITVHVDDQGATITGISAGS